jgi:hypothetical protein
MQRVWVFFIVALWSTVICKAAPSPQDGDGSGDPAPADTNGGGDDMAADAGTDLKEATELMTFLKMQVKMPLEMILQEKLFQPKKILKQTVQDTMNSVLELRKTVLDRIKQIRAGEVEINPKLNIKQEAFLNELRMDIMGVLLMLVEKDADNLESIQAVGKSLLAIRVKCVSQVMRLIMLRDTGAPVNPGDCKCEPFETLSNTTSPDVVKEAGGGDGAMVLNHLNMQLMTVDSSLEMKYMEILQEDDEEKRKEREDELFNLKEVSNCLNDVMIDVSAAVTPDKETDENKLNRILERQLNQCTTMVRRQVKQCKENCPGLPECNSCGATQIDDIVTKLKDWQDIIVSEGDESKKDDIRDEALTYLNTLDKMMTMLLNEKISNETDGNFGECEKEKLEVITNTKNPLWMLVNVTIFGDDALVEEMLEALIEAKEDMRKDYCKEETVTRVDTDSCVGDEISIAKEWTGTIDTLITEQIFVEDPNPVDVMLEIVKIKTLFEERVRDLFKDGLTCNEEVEQIKNVYNDQISKCLNEMMDPNYEFATLERHVRVDCMRQLRNKIEERRGMLWMRELMRKIQQQEEQGSGDDYDN